LSDGRYLNTVSGCLLQKSLIHDLHRVWDDLPSQNFPSAAFIDRNCPFGRVWSGRDFELGSTCFFTRAGAATGTGLAETAGVALGPATDTVEGGTGIRAGAGLILGGF
jgi:hypothetical protein